MTSYGPLNFGNQPVISLGSYKIPQHNIIIFFLLSFFILHHLFFYYWYNFFFSTLWSFNLGFCKIAWIGIKSFSLIFTFSFRKSLILSCIFPRWHIELSRYLSSRLITIIFYSILNLWTDIILCLFVIYITTFEVQFTLSTCSFACGESEAIFMHLILIIVIQNVMELFKMWNKCLYYKLEFLVYCNYKIIVSNV